MDRKIWSKIKKYFLPWFILKRNAVRGARKITNPNLGFQKQLHNFGEKNLKKVSLK